MRTIVEFVVLMTLFLSFSVVEWRSYSVCVWFVE